MKPSFKLALTLPLLFGGALRAQTFETEILASTGGIIGTDPSFRYSEIERPQINLHGEVCFRAQILEGDVRKEAIIRIVDGSAEIIALSGDLVSSWREEQGFISTAKFASFGDPVVNDEGRIAFLSEFELLGAQIKTASRYGVTLFNEATDEVWVLDRTDRIVKISGESGGEQFTDTARHLRLGDPIFDGGGGIYYPSVIQSSHESELGYRSMVYRIPIPSSSTDSFSQPDFIYRGDEYSPVSGDLAGEIPGHVDAHVSSSGDLNMIEQSVSGRRLIQSSNNQNEILLSEGDSLPDHPGYLVSNIQSYPEYLAGTSSFLVKARNGSLEKELILQGTAPSEILVSTGAPISDYESVGEVTDLSEPVATINGSIAFVATLESQDGGRRQSVWRKLAAGVAPRPLAIEGEQVPGSAEGVTYRSFGAPMINQIGQVVFSASLNHGSGINSQNDFAFFLGEPNRVVRRVIGEGDFFFFGFLDVQRITSLSLSEMNEQGDMALTIKAEGGQSALVKIGVPTTNLPSYGDWALAAFTNSENRGRNFDPDGDGIPNLLEYAYGTDPLDSLSSDLPEMRILEEEGVRTLALEFNQITSESDVEYIVEFSSDLTNWIISTNSVSLETRGDQIDRRLTSGVANPTSARQFVRIRIVER